MSDKTDHWMPLLIGNYLRDTQHLDAERHGCYLLWLMHYWTKGPLPNVIEDLVLIGKLHGPNAPSTAQRLLGQFFTLEADGLYHQKRADLEKARAGSLYERNQKGGRARAEKAMRGKGGKFTSGGSQPSQPNLKQAGDMAGPSLEVRWTSLNAPEFVHAGNSGENDQPNRVLASLTPATSPAKYQPIDQPRTSTTPTPIDSPHSGESIEKKKELFSPAVGFFSPPSSLRDQAQMIATAVIAGIGVTTRWARDELVKQAEFELRASEDLDPETAMNKIRDGMITQWQRYLACARQGKLKRDMVAPEKFYGDGKWKDSALWGLKKGMTVDGINA